MFSSGTFAKVKSAVDKTTKEEVAIKIIDKKQMARNNEGTISDLLCLCWVCKTNDRDADFESLMNEVNIMKSISHPNVIQLKEVYDSPNEFYMVMEMINGGELFDRIVDVGKYSEKDAARLFSQILDACRYLHSKGIVHRDLKPENLLLTSSGAEANIKIADFGLSKICGDDMVMRTACGTPGYCAPEILKRKGYDSAVDLWSCGVILYILLCGFPPFADDNLRVLFQTIEKGKYDFPSPWWDAISKEAKNLVQVLLVVDPAARPTATQALDHKWLKTESVAPLSLAVESMRKFNAKRRFKGYVLATIAQNAFAFK